MRAMTEIEWLDGRVTKVPELALGDALGESVQAELDFGFDDVLEGLWVEVRHHEPDEDSDGDPRGRGCAISFRKGSRPTGSTGIVLRSWFLVSLMKEPLSLA